VCVTCRRLLLCAARNPGCVSRECLRASAYAGAFVNTVSGAREAARTVSVVLCCASRARGVRPSPLLSVLVCTLIQHQHHHHHHRHYHHRHRHRHRHRLRFVIVIIIIFEYAACAVPAAPLLSREVSTLAPVGRWDVSAECGIRGCCRCGCGR